MGTDITPGQSSEIAQPTGITSWIELGAYVSAQGDRAKEWIESAIPSEGLLINGYYIPTVAGECGNVEIRYLQRCDGELGLFDIANDVIDRSGMTSSGWINLASEVESALRGEVGV